MNVYILHSDLALSLASVAHVKFKVDLIGDLIERNVETTAPSVNLAAKIAAP
jgi:hypothetical protein